MGRVIRKVAEDWEHPTDDFSEYIPMHDEYYGDAINEWVRNHQLWVEGKHPDQLANPENTAQYKFYAEWHGNAPDIKYYRTVQWTDEEACCFQYYETNTEGTPLSPVFEDLEEMEEWLIEEEDFSEEDAKDFCNSVR